MDNVFKTSFCAAAGVHATVRAGVTIMKIRPTRNRMTSASMATIAPWSVEQLAIVARGAVALRTEKLPHVTPENPTGTLGRKTGHKRGYQADFLRKLLDAVNAETGPNHTGETGRLDAMLQNISAALVSLNEPAIPGFKPGGADNRSKSEAAMLLGCVRIALADARRAAAELA